MLEVLIETIKKSQIRRACIAAFFVIAWIFAIAFIFWTDWPVLHVVANGLLVILYLVVLYPTPALRRLPYLVFYASVGILVVFSTVRPLVVLYRGTELFSMHPSTLGLYLVLISVIIGSLFFGTKNPKYRWMMAAGVIGIPLMLALIAVAAIGVFHFLSQYLF
jgi:hypothetical protein